MERWSFSLKIQFDLKRLSLFKRYITTSIFNDVVFEIYCLGRVGNKQEGANESEG